MNVVKLIPKSTPRTRAYRDRVSRGRRVGKIEYDREAVVARLTKDGLLDRWCDDEEQVDRAIEKLLVVYTAVIFTQEDKP
jgi:hypothetical protein